MSVGNQINQFFKNLKELVKPKLSSQKQINSSQIDNDSLTLREKIQRDRARGVSTIGHYRKRSEFIVEKTERFLDEEARQRGFKRNRDLKPLSNSHN
ncbi:hypothetical protein [Gracilimonas sediminicola]|uniref:Uncharacterized protein n=1 Tax=Gracilimonas sediminicola TaxID=2952158 RepID=A0A9X2RC07_9BACT|nr:hypothetical protein [Gracilimonas sediminicola]MCP9290546.1 hypothetical protein [Gracilimonas sediminicola]